MAGGLYFRLSCTASSYLPQLPDRRSHDEQVCIHFLSIIRTSLYFVKLYHKLVKSIQEEEKKKKTIDDCKVSI